MRLFPVCVFSLLVASLTGCSRQEPAPTKPAPKATSASQPDLSAGQAQPNAAPPPPPAPPGTTVAVAPAAPAAAAPGDGTVEAPADLSVVERLNWALGIYHIAHIESPPLTSFEPLIKAKLIKEVPKAPPGKKYVLDGPRWEVRLEDAK